MNPRKAVVSKFLHEIFHVHAVPMTGISKVGLGETITLLSDNGLDSPVISAHSSLSSLWIRNFFNFRSNNI